MLYTLPQSADEIVHRLYKLEANTAETEIKKAVETKTAALKVETIRDEFVNLAMESFHSDLSSSEDPFKLLQELWEDFKKKLASFNSEELNNQLAILDVMFVSALPSAGGRVSYQTCFIETFRRAALYKALVQKAKEAQKEWNIFDESLAKPTFFLSKLSGDQLVVLGYQRRAFGSKNALNCLSEEDYGKFCSSLSEIWGISPSLSAPAKSVVDTFIDNSSEELIVKFEANWDEAVRTLDNDRLLNLAMQLTHASSTGSGAVSFATDVVINNGRTNHESAKVGETWINQYLIDKLQDLPDFGAKQAILALMQTSLPLTDKLRLISDIGAAKVRSFNFRAILNPRVQQFYQALQCFNHVTETNITERFTRFLHGVSGLDKSITNLATHLQRYTLIRQGLQALEEKNFDLKKNLSDILTWRSFVKDYQTPDSPYKYLQDINSFKYRLDNFESFKPSLQAAVAENASTTNEELTFVAQFERWIDFPQNNSQPVNPEDIALIGVSPNEKDIEVSYQKIENSNFSLPSLEDSIGSNVDDESDSCPPSQQKASLVESLKQSCYRMQGGVNIWQKVTSPQEISEAQNLARRLASEFKEFASCNASAAFFGGTQAPKTMQKYIDVANKENVTDEELDKAFIALQEESARKTQGCFASVGHLGRGRSDWTVKVYQAIASADNLKEKLVNNIHQIAAEKDIKVAIAGNANPRFATTG